MSVTFTKLFSSITESTVWCEPDRTRLCWICMLAMADRHGRVFASVPGLANRARVPVEDARKAIETFLSPDADSRTPEHEGRRIEAMDGGWRLLNHAKYRDIRDEESILESKRKYINNRRAAERAAASTVEKSRSPVDRGRANAEADTEALKKTSASLPDWLPKEAWDGYMEARKKAKKPTTDRAKKLLIAKLEGFKDAGYDVAAALDASTEAGWSSVYEPKNGSASSVMDSGRERV